MKDEMNTNISVNADERITGLLAGLPRVAAPGDFDLRLRGRIARNRTATSGGFRLPAALAYALGLGVVLIAFGLVGMVWIYSGNVGDVPAVATAIAPATTVPSALTAPTSSASINNPLAPEIPARSAPNMRAVAVKPPVLTAEPRLAAIIQKTTVSPETSAGSLPDTAVKEARKLYPKGINPAAPSGTPDIIVPVIKPVDAKEVLAVLGVNATVVDGKVRIGSVNAGSAGENAGLKEGDVVQSINDQNVNESSRFPGTLKATNIRVQRDGKPLGIVLPK
jgi:PDZ domain